MSPSGSAVVSMTKIPIRDHMDDIVESRGYYRKHVAQEKNSLFRAISDFLYSSQCFRDDLQLALKYFLDSEEGRRVVEQLQESGIQDHPHAEVILMANVLNESFDILDTADPEVERLRIVPHSVNLDVKFSLLASTDCIPPGMQITENRHDSHQGKKPIFLCYSGRHQYDPIYNKSSVDAAGFIQSILYERLYKDVFGVTDAMEAADIMLNGTFDPRYGKPDVYDKDFEGTAMEALQKFLIPFPYKVAKALDSESYRNIEYDVWTCERRPKSRSGGNNNNNGPNVSNGRKSSLSPDRNMRSDRRSVRTLTIGGLREGTPVSVRIPFQGEAYGFIRGPSQDRRSMQVLLSHWPSSLFVPRKLIFPLKNPPKEMGTYAECKAAFEAIEASSMWTNYNLGNMNFQNFNAEPCHDPACQPFPHPGNVQLSNRIDKARLEGTSISSDPSDLIWLQSMDFSIPPPAPPPVTSLPFSQLQAATPTTPGSSVCAGQFVAPNLQGPFPCCPGCPAISSPMLPNAAPAQLPATFAAPVDNPSFNGPTNTLTNVDPAVVYTVDQNGNFAFGALNTPSPIQDMVATSPDAGLGSQIVYMSMPFQVIPGPSQGIVDSVAGSAQFLPMTPPAAVPGYVSVPNAGVSSNNRPNVLEQTLVYGVTSSSVPGPFLATPGVTPDSGIVPDKDSFTQYDGDTNYFQYPPTSKTQS